MNSFPPKQKQVIEAAILEFQNNGFNGTSMSSIAKEAGISKKKLKELFSSKDEVFKYVFLELYGRIAPQLQDILDGDMPVIEKIRHFTNNYVSFINDYKFLPLGLIRKLNSKTDFAKEFIVNLRMPDPNKFYRQVEKEIEAGRIREINPKQLIINIFALSVFPHVASPLMKDFISAGNDEFEMIKKKGGTLVADFIINSIQVPVHA
ncbi:TetR/AcrR family transcriptional regulator [Lutimonas saemankumensis]|uniref:TetR/AcrR family transcriptional regulator n=1 Tax=Lutimonas saemankumensis TaxID=483016 RepID=UPI001CD2EA0F|nr:TetR/AcrR family transcriptional regulator [Lutimonas saemankumensis]MCA0931909.1 TetR/AcrR family transcriptional regulator [Lutimonas saemankumensis]